MINPFLEDGYEVNFNWKWHLENAHLAPIPGVDYDVAPGGAVRACMDGYCEWAQMTDGLHMVSIKLPNGDKVTYRELATVSAQVLTAHVSEGDVIGTATGVGGKSPHWEYDHANGTYDPVENFIPAPTPTPLETEMTLRIIGNPASGAWIPNQPAPVGPYVSGSSNPAVQGGNYYLLNGETGLGAQIFGPENYIDMLGDFITNATTKQYTQAEYVWLQKTLASVGASGGSSVLTSAQITTLAADVAADIQLPAGLTAAQEQAMLSALEAAIIAKIPSKITGTIS